jgi:hypothetical protein
MDPANTQSPTRANPSPIVSIGRRWSLHLEAKRTRLQRSGAVELQVGRVKVHGHAGFTLGLGHATYVVEMGVGQDDGFDGRVLLRDDR